MQRWQAFAANRPQRQSPLYTKAEEVPVTFWLRNPSYTPGGWHHPAIEDPVGFGNNLPPLHIDGKGDVVPMVGKAYAFDQLELNGLNELSKGERREAFVSGRCRVEAHFKSLTDEELFDRLWLEPLLTDNGDPCQMNMWTFPEITGRLLFLHGATMWGAKGVAMEQVSSPTELLRMIAERRELELLEGRLELKAAGVTSFGKFVKIGQWGEGGHRFGSIGIGGPRREVMINGGRKVDGYFSESIWGNPAEHFERLLYFVDGKRYSLQGLAKIPGTFFGVQYQDATEEPPGMEIADFMRRDAKINQGFIPAGTPGPAVLQRAIFLPKIRLIEHSNAPHAGSVSLRITPESPMAGLRMREILLECKLDQENSIFAAWHEAGTVRRNLAEFFRENGCSLRNLITARLLYFYNNHYEDGIAGHPHFPIMERNHPSHGRDEGMDEFYKFFLNNMDLSGHWADLGEFRVFPEDSQDVTQGISFALGTHLIFLTRLINQLKEIKFFKDVADTEWDDYLSSFMGVFDPSFQVRVEELKDLSIINDGNAFKWTSYNQLVTRLNEVAQAIHSRLDRSDEKDRKVEKPEKTAFDQTMKSIIEQWQEYYRSRLTYNMLSGQWRPSPRDIARGSKNFYRDFPGEYFIPKTEEDFARMEEIIEREWGLEHIQLKELLLALMKAGMNQSETVMLGQKKLTLKQAFKKFNKIISEISG